MIGCHTEFRKVAGVISLCIHQVFEHFPMHHMKIILGDFNVKMTFSNRQLGLRLYIRIVKIMVLE